MPEFLFGPIPHDEAIDFIKTKPVVSREVFNNLLPELQARAFTISGAIPAEVVQHARDLVAGLPAGQPWETQKRMIVSAISPWVVDPDGTPEERLKQQAAATAKAEILLRVHGHEAYSSASYQVMDRQRRVFEYWQYQSMRDERVRPTHRALDGLVIHNASPFWLTHFPPWDWGCRCIAIPLSDAGVDVIRRADAKRAPEERLVLEGPLLRELEQNHRLVRGMNNIVNVQSPADAGKSGAFRFNPADVRITVEQLKGRYDAQTWNSFEKWARKTDVGDGRSVWNWISGEPGGPEVFQVPALSEGAAARRSPVSAAFDVRIRDRAFRSEMEEVLAGIDRTHDDGAIPRLALRSSRARDALGEFKVSKNIVEVQTAGPWRRLTLAHEAGHVLDYYGFGQRAVFSSEAGEPLLAAWSRAIDQSQAIRSLGSAPNVWNRSYFMRRREQFARSYAQYIAGKTQHPELLADVDRILKTLQPWRQWQWDDFAPIAKAFDDFFVGQGWAP